MQQLHVRNTYQTDLAQVREQFADATDGVAIVRAVTRAVEKALSHIYASCLARRGDAERVEISRTLALVAIGGFARRELCPFSDVDLLFLHPDNPSAAVESFLREVVREIWDCGLSLGQNVGTPKQMLALAQHEILPATSFLDARLVTGAADLYETFRARYEKQCRSNGTDLFLRALSAVREDQKKYGATVQLLEPNVKRSAGGLRDIHVVLWSVSAMHGPQTLEEMEAKGLLGSGDAGALSNALSFLLRLRCELHFHAERLHDDLLRLDQVRIAKEWGYSDAPGRLAVESFMSDYFRHATSVADVLERFVERCRPRSLMSNARELFLTRRCGDGVWIGPDRLLVAARRRRQVASRLEEILELAVLAAQNRVRFDYHLTEALRRHHLFEERIDPATAAPALRSEVARLFLRFLSRPGTQAPILRVLHRTGVLSRILPDFEHARCLLSFNAYHKYTVDEHTFVVVENIESFAARRDRIGRAYAAVAEKEILHLAALLHDLGKGYQENHSDVGRQIALATADRLALKATQRELLAFLVHKHLLLSDLAMKRDISDPHVWVLLAKEVRDAQRLKALYCLTVADIMGVGPGIYTQWTADLLETLYRNALAVLGETQDAENSVELWESRRRELLARHASAPRLCSLIDALPASYLAEVDSGEIERHLAMAQTLTNGGVEVLTSYRPETKTTTYTVVTSERASESVFSKICGGLAAHHMDVLRARIYTLADGTVIDQFDVRDTHCFGDPTPERVNKVATTIRRILTGELSVLDALYSTRSSMFGVKQDVQRPVETCVTLDNATSDTCTVIDVFTNNRRGLLYTLARGISRLGLSVQYAKIATYEDEAADVFYVRDIDGRKIENPDRIRLVEQHLAADVRALATNPRAMGF